MELKGKKILIVGTGISGIAAAKLLQKENQLILFDGNEKAVAEDIEKKLDNTDNIQIVIGKIPDNIFSEIQVAVVSPGVPMDSSLVISLKEKNIPFEENNIVIDENIINNSIKLKNTEIKIIPNTVYKKLNSSQKEKYFNLKDFISKIDIEKIISSYENQ